MYTIMTKLLFALVVIITYLSVVKSGVIQFLAGTPSGEVTFLESDSNSTIYAAIGSNGLQYFCVTYYNKAPNCQITNYLNFLMTKNNGLYLIQLNESTGSYSIHRFFTDFSLEFVDDVDIDSPSQIYWFIDEEDNLFCNTKSGVKMLKPGKKFHHVTNLENSAIMNHNIDNLGNIYLIARSLDEGDVNDQTIYMISKESKQKTVRHNGVDARIIRGINNRHPVIEIKSHNELVIFGGEHFLKILYDGSSHIIESRVIYHGLVLFKTYNNIHPTSKGFFYTPQHEDDDVCQLWYYQYSSAKAVQIKYNYRPKDECNQLAVSDSEGNTYFGFGFDGSGTYIYHVKNNAKDIIPIHIQNTLLLSSMAIDENGDLWILAEDLYWLKKDTKDLVQIPGLPYTTDHVKMKLINGSYIVLGTARGLYLFMK